ncbi:cytochrome P450 [Bisporella sp. PMI_857]|nr:cytochrome P450 [Bisporella sp. PMI_857]
MALIWIVLTLLVAQAIYTIISRLFLHPLAVIPGPKLAALTSWYEFYYDVIRSGQYVWHIQDLHARYGPIVRVAPGEIHIKDPSFLDEIYAPASRRRDKYWFNQRGFKIPESVGATVKHELHRRRREVLNPFFSTKSVTAFEPIIREKMWKLQALFEEHAKDQTAINLSDVYFGFARDVVSNYCFGHDENLLANERKASIYRNNMLEIFLGIKLSQHLPWISNFLGLLPFSMAKHIMPAGMMNNIALNQDISRGVQNVLNDLENVKKGKQRSILYELRDNQDLPPSEKSLSRLASEGGLLVMAGTESTSRSLAITHFYLLHHKDVLARVRTELNTIPHPVSWSELQKLPYLNGCIAEGNRLSFGVTARMRRVATDETLEYRQYKIPPGTPVSQTSLSVHTDEAIFRDPWSFRPERWVGKEGVELHRYQMAFNKGSRSCLGINLAHAEMFLVIAAVARYDMKLYHTNETDVKFQHDFQVAFPKLGSKGVRAVVQGKLLSNIDAIDT